MIYYYNPLQKQHQQTQNPHRQSLPKIEAPKTIRAHAEQINIGPELLKKVNPKGES
jgi:hypothetical protein